MIPVQEIRLERDLAESGLIYWRLLDRRGRIILPFMDYVIKCVDFDGLDAKTVESRAYTLKKWYRFLATARINYLEADDMTIRSFRDSLLGSIARNSSGNEQARKRTINLDLRNLYFYYGWLQQTERYSGTRQLIGLDGCQIRSSLLERANEIDFNSRSRFPLTFRRAGENSKHRLGFVPAESERAELTEYFFETQRPEVAKRNCLIFDLAWLVGWRRGSIVSLKVSQFLSTEQTQREHILMCPPSQKNGASNSFRVPIDLFNRVVRYIEQERAVIVRDTGCQSDAVFLNLRSGTAILAESVSGIFSKARRVLGWPKGAALHAWRRGYANRELERELDARLELGLDTSGEAIAVSLATKLGQQNIKSQESYIRDVQRRIRGTATYRDKTENAALADLNASLIAEIAYLRAQLADAKSWIK